MAPRNKFITETRAADPATRAWEVEPNDVEDLEFVSRALYVGGAGDVAVRMSEDVPSKIVTFTAVPAGTVLPIRVRRVLATGTTATNIVLLY